MKKLLLLFFISFFTSALKAQDIIFKTTGEELEVKVTEITQHDIVYKYPDSLQGHPLTIPKNSVFMVKFANGTKEIFSRIDSLTNTFVGLNSRDMYNRGRADAKKLYKGNNAMWGTAGITMVLGLPAPIIIGAIPPKINYEQVSELSLLQNPHYVRGYKQQAHKKKIGKVAAGAGIGAGLMLTMLYVFISSIGY